MQVEQLIDVVAATCRSWGESPQACEMIVSKDDVQNLPNLQFRYNDNPESAENWFSIELRYFNQEVTKADIETYLGRLPEGRKFKEKVIVSTKGFTQEASILASMEKIWLSHFAEDSKTPGKYGYLIPRVSKHDIKTPMEISAQKWNVIHYDIERSGWNYMRGKPPVDAIIKDKDGNKICDFISLEFGLEKKDSISYFDYTYDFPDCTLVIGEEDPIPLESITYRYYTSLREVKGENMLDALCETLSIYIFG